MLIMNSLLNLFFGKKIKPCVVWMTGLSGSGKTTICKNIYNKLINKNKVVLLDGDEIRNMFPSTGFDEASRKEHNRRIAYMAKLLKDNGIIVLVSLISPYNSSREEARKICGDRFYEVYISTSIDECIKRDVKGLYMKVKSGEIKNFTGIDTPYEVPSNPDIIINTLEKSIDDCGEYIIQKLKE